MFDLVFFLLFFLLLLSFSLFFSFYEGYRKGGGGGGRCRRRQVTERADLARVLCPGQKRVELADSRRSLPLFSCPSMEKGGRGERMARSLVNQYSMRSTHTHTHTHIIDLDF